ALRHPHGNRREHRPDSDAPRLLCGFLSASLRGRDGISGEGGRSLGGRPGVRRRGTAVGQSAASFRLGGTHALVTGAGRGIGRASAVALAEAGAPLTAVSRSEEELESVVAEVEAFGGTAYAFAADVRDSEQVDAAVQAACEQGEFFACVNSAGLNR